MSKPSENVTKVKIFDQTYSVQGGEASEYLEQLAQYVDDKMRKISGGSNVADTQKLAVLAALNIAADYYTLRKEFEELVEWVQEHNRGARQMLDEVLSAPKAKQQSENVPGK